MFLGFSAVHLWRSYKNRRSSPSAGSKLEWLTKNSTVEFALIGVGALLLPLFLPSMAGATNLLIRWSPLATQTLGGSLIGGSVGLMMLVNGQVLGLSGIIGGLVNPQTENKGTRLCFTLGLGLGSILAQRYLGADLSVSATSTVTAAVGGMLMGAGSAAANGCTSGHGICGITRLSRRSIVATASFFAAALAISTLFKTSSILF